MALESVYAQRLRPDWAVEVLIVDDGSPSPPELSVEESFPRGFTVKVLKRTNGGPAAARNTGLDGRSRRANYIAFLDSDDQWVPDHLKRATGTLASDADFYFSDQGVAALSPFSTHFRELCSEHGGSEFQRSGLPAKIVASDLANPIILPHGPEGSYVFTERQSLTALLRGFLPHTSSTVIRAEQLGHIRFRDELRTAGEDYLYFLTLANLARKTCYSKHVGAVRGRGVSIYYGAFSWDSPRSLDITLDNYRCVLFAKSTLDLDATQTQILAKRVSFRRLELVARIASEAKRGRLPSKNIFRAISRSDPTFLALFPFLFFRVLYRLLIGKPVADRTRINEIG